jgi:hypothetical protein
VSSKTYDTRSRDEIIAAPHFARLRADDGLNQIGLRELRTLDQFFGFAATREIGVPTVSDFLNFTQVDTSTRRLDNLRTAFDRILSPDAPVCQTIRDAIRAKRPRSRVCDRNSRAGLHSDPMMAPYRDLSAWDDVALEDLRVFARFLKFSTAHQIAVPKVDDYLHFSADVASSRRLRSLKVAIDTLLPGNPAGQVVLAEAIRRKGPPRVSKAGLKPRQPAKRRVPLSRLPELWQTLLHNMRQGLMPVHKAVLALSVIDSIEDVLREYVKAQRDADAPPDISIEGVRRFEASRAEYAHQRQAPQYADQGNRPATQHTVIMRVRQFAQALDLDPRLCSALKAHENVLRRANGTTVSLKFAKLDALPSLAGTWALATRLLNESANKPKLQTRLRLLNEASILALWTLLPLRLKDGQLRWGRDITYDGGCYWINITTQKEDEPLQGKLHMVLTPFFDALVLRSMNSAYLNEIRQRAITGETPMFGGVDGRMLSSGYPSQVWRVHMGTGAHISRSRIHSELGQLGADGVNAALALNAQRDEQSRIFYQSKAVAAAQRLKGQAMIDGLLAKCIEDPAAE